GPRAECVASPIQRGAPALHPSTMQRADPPPAAAAEPVAWFETLNRGDVPRVGGKNASLGEMIGALGAVGVRVPPGFATTAAAYWRLLREAGIEAPLRAAVERFRAGASPL